MSKLRRWKSVYIFSSVVALVAISLPFFLATPVSAATKGLTLSPLRTELEIAPGTALDGTLTVTNSTENAIAVGLNAEAFSVINEQYDYAFTAESEVAKWVSFTPQVVNLPVGGSAQVHFTVGVPLSAEPGGRYISMFASTDSKSASEGINSRQRIASLLYINVSGDVTREGHLVSLSSPWFIEKASAWTAALQNTGTTHYRSRYNTQVQNIFSNEVIASEAGDALILPGSVRAISGTVPAPKYVGIYKIVYTIGLGDTPAKIETRYLLYVPLSVRVVIILAAIGLIIAMPLRKYFRRVN